MVRSRRLIISISLFIIFGITAFLVTYVFITSSNTQILQLVNSGFVSSDAVTLSITEDISIAADKIQSAMEKGTYLFRKTDDKGDVLEFYSISPENKFPIQTGKQFQTTASFQGMTQVMKGKNSEYPADSGDIIAQLGIEEPSLMDYQTFIYPSSDNRTVLNKGNWICDGTGNVNKSASQLCDLLGSSCTIVDTQQIGLYRMSQSENLFSLILFLVLCCCILACVPLIHHWNECCFFERQCYERMGFSIMQQWRCFLKQLLLLAAPSLIIGICLALISLHTSPAANAAFIACEFCVEIVVAALLHGILFFTSAPQYPWSEKK